MRLVARAQAMAYGDRISVQGCHLEKLGLAWWRLIVLGPPEPQCPARVFVDVHDRVVSVVTVDDAEDTFDLVFKEWPAHEYPDVDFSVRVYRKEASHG